MPKLDAVTNVLNQLILSYWASPSSAPLQIHFPPAQSDDKRIFVQCGDVTVIDDSYNAFVRMLSNFRTVQHPEVAAVDEPVVSHLFAFYKRFANASNAHLDRTGDPSEYRVMKSGNGIMELRVDKSGFTLDLLDDTLPDRQLSVQESSVIGALNLAEQSLGLNAPQQPGPQPQLALS